MQVEKKYLSLPLTAQLEITDYCNHRCVHCYNLYSEVQNRPSRKVGACQLLKPLYEGLQQEEDLQLDMNFDQFKQEFNDHFSNVQ